MKFKANPQNYLIILISIIGLGSSYFIKSVKAQVLFPQPFIPLEDLSPLNPTDPSELLLPPVNEDMLVKTFEFEGNNNVSDKILNQALKDLINQTLSPKEIEKTKDLIREVYKDQEQPLIDVYIVQKDVINGVLNFLIVENKIFDVNLDVTGRLNPNHIASRLDTALSLPLDLGLLLNELENLQLDLLVDNINFHIPNNEKILHINVQGKPDFLTQIVLNNNSQPTFGTIQRGFGLSHHLIGIGDSLNFSFLNTDSSNIFDFNYTLPITPQNSLIKVNYNYGESDLIEPPFNILNPQLDQEVFNFIFRQPILQYTTPQLAQELALGFAVSDVERKTRLLNNIPFPLELGADQNGKFNITTLRFFQDYTQRTDREVLSLLSSFNVGINAFNATINPESIPDSEFFSWRGNFQWYRLLGEPTAKPQDVVSLLFRTGLQFSTDPLPITEQISIGGQSTVRGYRENLLFGDNGFFASAELQIPVIQIPELDSTIQLIPFVDFGQVWNDQKRLIDQIPTDGLISTGLGLQWQMNQQLKARIDYGIPLVEFDPSDQSLQENGFYFFIEYNPF